VSQELGGKSANIILDDSSFEKSVKQGVIKCMENSGQSCNAPTRMLVPFRRLEESFFIAKSVCNSLIVGNPQNEDTDVGPLANVKQYKKVKDLIHTGINDGAKIITGGSNRPKNIDSGYFIEPTVFAYVTEEMSIFKEEIFGPVLTITHYHDYEHALDIANNTDYGLAAYVSGIEKNDLLKLSKRLNAGQVYINYSSGGTEAPFGGLKMSGNGREKGRWGLNEFLETKAIIGE
jgi:aldehyde dehydrogenase (NAD+)